MTFWGFSCLNSITRDRIPLEGESMEDWQIKELIEKYLEGTLTPEEKGLLESWYSHEAESNPDGISDQEVKESLKRIQARLPLERQESRRSHWPRIAAAAAIVLVSGVGLFVYIQKQFIQQPIETAYKNDVEPGSNKAFLTLADGKRITLADAANGTLAKQAGVLITKIADGKLEYTISDPKVKASTIEYNIIETPKGGRYQVNLPDGSKIWLNAASLLKFPATFASLKERKVELSGEAYFEVAQNDAHPFIVTTDKQTVKVLGTHFNISSYANDPAIKTTLLEGSVKVTGTRGNNKVLQPGQQSSLIDGHMIVENIDTELAVAWKNNQFMFESERIENIMKMVERWYNVEVEYVGEIPDDRFGGAVSRFDNVSKVLSILELTGKVHFRIEGRKIYVSK